MPDYTIRTVEEAKQFAMHVALAHFAGDLGLDQFNDAMDALIAAVRAEHDAPSEPMRCRHCGAACQVDECLDCWRQQREAR